MKTLGFSGLLTIALVLGACFDTPTADIAFRCGAAGECPDGYECRDDGCCHRIGSRQDLTCQLADASQVVDARAIDAPADAMPADATPADATPADATPADATPADAMPADAMLGPGSAPSRDSRAHPL